jgi:serine/threonine protein kinase/tetratricopeptide (TPR) repeat protein
MKPLIGRTLGHYRITEQIGAGGMGEIYRATDERLDRDVAVKVLPEELAQDAERLTRFEREAKAVAQLAHPNILEIWDFGSSDGITYAVMELLEGETLREVISKGCLTTGKAVAHARVIADGLAAAHDKGIIHRDIKPENIFLTVDGRIKILDFGLAKLRLPDQDFSPETQTATLNTAPGSLIGTVAYMAPEQVQGQPVDHRSDIFALGVVLYEMLTGRRPFGGSTTVETAAAILKEDPEPIATASLDVTASLATVVLNCLEKRPEDRFSSARDLALTLGAVESTAPPALIQEPRFISRRWPHVLAITIAAAIALFVVLPPEGLFEWLAQQPRDPVPPRIVILPFENLGPPDDEFFADGITEEITARVASVKGLQVISRTSAVQYGGAVKTIKEMGEELGVGYVLEGTVRWARGEGASRIRITPQLIRVEDDTNLWTESYDRILDDVFQIQSEIAQNVTEHLGIVVSGGEKAGTDFRPTDDLDAYQAYLRGRFYATRPHFTYENWDRAMAAYQQAVDLDPDFALAHANLARGHALVHYFRHDLTPERVRAADEAAARALQLAPESPRVRLALGYYRLWAYRDVENALEEFARSDALQPDNAEILDAMGSVFIVQGRWEEALDAYQRAFELSPREADLIVSAGWVLWTLRRYPEAITAADQAINLAPDSVWPYLYKAFAMWSWDGSTSRTRAVLEALPAAAGGWGRWAWYWQDVYEGKYRDAIDGLEPASDHWIRIKMFARPDVLFAAHAYKYLGETERAGEAYERAREILEPAVEASPEDPRLHSSLGIAYAALGRRQDAIGEGLLATELLTRAMDGYYYIPFVVDLAHIYTIVGEDNAAIDQIEYLLTNPSWISVPMLEMDPRWNPLRDNPRFQALLEEYGVHD